MKSKKGAYWVFGFDTYYPSGGMDDFLFSFNDIEEFEKEIELRNSFCDTYQIFRLKDSFIFQGDLGTVTKWICKNIGDEIYEKGKEFE